MAKARRKGKRKSARRSYGAKKVARKRAPKRAPKRAAKRASYGAKAARKRTAKRAPKRASKRTSYGAKKRPENLELFATISAPSEKAAPKKAAKKAAAKKAAPKKTARRTQLASKARAGTSLAKPHAPSKRKGPKPCKKCGLYHSVKEHASHRVPTEFVSRSDVFSGLYGGLYGAKKRPSKPSTRLALQAINVELAGPVTPARARKLHAERAKLLAKMRRAK